MQQALRQVPVSPRALIEPPGAQARLSSRHFADGLALLGLTSIAIVGGLIVWLRVQV